MRILPVITVTLCAGVLSACAALPKHPPRCSGEGAMRPVNPAMITPGQKRKVTDAESRKVHPVLQFLREGQNYRKDGDDRS